MKLRCAAILFLFAAIGLWAQTGAPASGVSPLAGRARVGMATTTDADSKTAEMKSKALMNERLQEMQSTVDRMHLLLKQMQATAAAKGAKDSMTKANLEMWGLVIQQMDKQFDQLKLAARQREELDARRSALYKQADQKAAMAAKNAQSQAASDAAAQGNSGSATPIAAPSAPAQSPQAPAPSSNQ